MYGFETPSTLCVPDTGVQQSMVSEDLVETLGLKIEHSTKAVKAVDGGRVTYLSSSTVQWWQKISILSSREERRFLYSNHLSKELLYNRITFLATELNFWP